MEEEVEKCSHGFYGHVVQLLPWPGWKAKYQNLTNEGRETEGTFLSSYPLFVGLHCDGDVRVIDPGCDGVFLPADSCSNFVEFVFEEDTDDIE
jgi:hypothetical protein